MPKTRRMLCGLLAPLIGLLLTGCETADPLTPDRARFAPVPMPVAPPGEAVCNGTPCLSERQSAYLFNETIDVACEANDRLAWLSDFYLGTVLGPSCAK